MTGYQLTEDQKALLRQIVGYVRAGKLSEPILVIKADNRGYLIPVREEDTIQLESLAPFEIFCHEDLMGRDPDRRYYLKQAAYEAVDSNFVPPSTPPAGDTLIMSGNFQGAILNIQSTLTQVSQTIAASPHVAPSAKEELQDLVDQLKEALQQVPADKAEEAEAVAKSAELLVKEATGDKPNKTMVQITGESLKQAAQNIATVTPLILTIAGQIVAKINELGGLPAG